MKEKLVIIGFGAQAKSWALNLRDSKREVVIALREGSSSIELAHNAGFQTCLLNETELSKYEYFINLTPDHVHDRILQIISKLNGNKVVVYAHGYSVTAGKYHDKYPNIDHLLLAPKAIASEVRFQYETNGKLGAAFDCQRICTERKELRTKFIKNLATDLGITAGPYQASFEDETKADLFSEQSILCSAIPYGAMLSYNLLRKKGISKEIAYLECWYEVKLIANAIIELGPEKFFKLISPNALIGGEKARKILFDNNYQEKLERLLEDISSGNFQKEIENTDFEKVQRKVLDFWRSQEISETHNQLEKSLF